MSNNHKVCIIGKEATGKSELVAHVVDPKKEIGARNKTIGKVRKVYECGGENFEIDDYAGGEEWVERYKNTNDKPKVIWLAFDYLSILKEMQNIQNEIDKLKKEKKRSLEEYCEKNEISINGRLDNLGWVTKKTQKKIKEKNKLLVAKEKEFDENCEATTEILKKFNPAEGTTVIPVMTKIDLYDELSETLRGRYDTVQEELKQKLINQCDEKKILVTVIDPIQCSSKNSETVNEQKSTNIDALKVKTKEFSEKKQVVSQEDKYPEDEDESEEDPIYVTQTEVQSINEEGKEKKDDKYHSTMIEKNFIYHFLKDIHPNKLNSIRQLSAYQKKHMPGGKLSDIEKYLKIASEALAAIELKDFMKDKPAGEKRDYQRKLKRFIMVCLLKCSDLSSSSRSEYFTKWREKNYMGGYSALVKSTTRFPFFCKDNSTCKKIFNEVLSGKHDLSPEEKKKQGLPLKV